jgi:hypothetical protein
MTKLSADIQANLDLFIQETKQTKLVWGLRNAEEDWLACDSSQFENSEVMPFWSNQRDAAVHNVEEWAEFSVCEIPLDVFVEDWLVTLAEDGVLIGANWTEALEGDELEPADLVKRYL